MAKAKRDKNKRKKDNVLVKLKKMDTLSKCFIAGFLISGVVLVGVSARYVYVNEQAYLRDIEYEDPSANFIIVPPDGWTASTPSRSNVESVIQETTEGGIFDVSRYALKEEIVPVVLVEDAKASAESGVSGSSYISVALRGYNSSNDRLYDKSFCEDYLGILLKTLDVKDVKYTNAEILKRGNFNGTFVQAEAMDNGVKVYYSQYQEVIGENVLTLTFGTTKKDMDSKSYIDEALKHLEFKVLTDDEFAMDILSLKLKEDIPTNEKSEEDSSDKESKDEGKEDKVNSQSSNKDDGKKDSSDKEDNDKNKDKDK